MQQSIIQQITSSLSDSCAWLVLDSRAKIQEHNVLAKNILATDKKNLQKADFLTYIEGVLENELKEIINGKTWTGDIKIKKTSREYYSTFLPIQENKSDTQIVVSIYPNVSEKFTRRSPKFFKLLQNTSDGILLLNAETGNILETNETALKYLGYTHEEILEKTFKQIDVELNGQTGLSWKKFLIELKQKSPEALQTLSRYIQKNGSIIPVESSISYEENEGDAYISILFKDVSSHDRIEEILDAQQKKFQLLIENLDDSILLLDEGANIMYASPAAHKNWGYQNNELQEQYLFDLVHPYDSSLVKKIFFEIINTRRKLFRTTFRILYKDGSDHWMEVKAKNLLREPSINAVLMIVQNVTQQTLAEEKIIQALETEKKLNEELAQREEKLKNTLDIIKQKEIELKKANQILEDAQTFAKMGSWHIETEPEESIAWSKQTFIAFGMNPFIDKTPRNSQELRQLIHEDDRIKLLELYQRVLSGETETYEIELRQYQKNDDAYRWFLTKAQSVKNEENKIIGISGITLDIHERKLAEEKLRQTNDELSKANSELDRFVYSVSHDLRAPISSLLGLIQLSRMTDDVEEVKQYMSLQEKSIQRLDNFIKDILDYSRNARLEFTPEPISFKEILENCFEQHNHMENAKRIETIIKINEEKIFYSDKNRLNIIFNNLLSNAIKYANQRQLRCYIQVFVETDDKEVKVEIQDNGIGIGKEHINKVFNMFYRANDSLAGSGLGLYIVKETVNKLQGFIKLDSELGQGTRIVLTLPNKKNEINES